MHRFLSAAEAAALLGVTRETARAAAASGRIPAARTSAGWMLDATAVAKEVRMRRAHGRLTPDEAQRMLVSFPAGTRRDEMAATLDLLTDWPVTVGAADDDPLRPGEREGELEADRAALYEATRRSQSVAASARPTLNDDYRAVTGMEPPADDDE